LLERSRISIESLPNLTPSSLLSGEKITLGQVNTKVIYFVELTTATLHARALPLAGALSEYGVECQIILPINWWSKARALLGNSLSAALTHSPKDYLETINDKPDVVIIGRSSSPQLYFLQKVLKRRGIKVIFDLDVPIFLPTIRLVGIDFRSPAYSCLEKIIMEADAVIASNHYLLAYARRFNQKAFLVHVPVDNNIFSPQLRKHSGKITVGWQGNPGNHIDNLAMLIKPLEELAKNHSFRLKIASYMGDHRVTRMFKKLENLVEIDYGSNHWLSLSDFANELSDIEIMASPLTKNVWNEGKSALRASIGMSMGIPMIASPVGEQKYVIRHGYNGFLAGKEEDWPIYIGKLIEDKELRISMGKRARETIERDYSLHACGEKHYNILKDLLQ
jgi:glycosyltransferase involved in cell wall biosynthesis